MENDSLANILISAIEAYFLHNNHMFHYWTMFSDVVGGKTLPFFCDIWYFFDI